MSLKAISFLAVSCVLVTSADGADWGGKEVLASTHVAMSKFAKDHGEKTFAQVSGVATKLSEDKTAAKVSVSYGEKKTEDFDVKAGDIADSERYTPPRAAEEDWGGKEVQTSAEAAMTAFIEKRGKAAYLTVSNISVVITIQKNTTQVKITYMDGKDEKIQKFFCHLHEAEIDCH